MLVNKDIYEYITNFADDRVVLNMLSVNKRFRDDEVFKRVVEKRFPFKKTYDTSWKQHYIETIYYSKCIEIITGFRYNKNSTNFAHNYYYIIKEATVLKQDLLSYILQFASFNDLAICLIEKNVYKNEIFLRAIDARNSEIVKYLIEKEIFILEIDRALQRLTRQRFPDLNLVKYLVEKGANINTIQDPRILEYISSVK